MGCNSLHSTLRQVSYASQNRRTKEGVMKNVFLLPLFLLLLNVPVLGGDTVLVGTFFNGNNAALNSRAYLWNPTTDDADITARVYTLPLIGPSTLLGTVNLGPIHARSGKNIKIAEEILFKLGIFLPYTGDGGNLIVEFTVGADNVRGTGQVFGPNLAFGTYPLEVMSTDADTTPSQTTKELQLEKLIGFWRVTVPGLQFASGTDNALFANIDIVPASAVDFALIGFSESLVAGYTIWDVATQRFLTFVSAGGFGNIYQYALTTPTTASGCVFLTDGNFQNPGGCFPMTAARVDLSTALVFSTGPSLLTEAVSP